MNEPGTIPPAAPQSNDHEAQINYLSRQVSMLFAALIVTSFTLTVFLGLEARRAARDYSAIKPQADQALKVIQQDDATVASVYSKLVEFGKTHPDFQTKVLSKYSVDTNSTAAAPKK